MALKYLMLGIFVKIITGLDDTITHVPIIASVAKNMAGKIAFSIGMLIAIAAAIAISIFFAEFIRHFHYYRYIAAGLIFILAAAMYFDVFVHKPKDKGGKKAGKDEEDFSRKVHAAHRHRVYCIICHSN